MNLGTRLSGLRARLILGYAVVVVVLAGAWAWSLFGPLSDSLVEQQRGDLVVVARAGVSVLDATMDLEEATSGMVDGSDVRITVVDPAGVVLADTQEDATAMENHADRPEIAAALEGRVGSDVRLSATQDVEQLYVAIPASLDGDGVAYRVSRPLDRIESVASRARTTGLALLVLALGISVIVAYRVSTSSADPISRLARTARSIAGGNLSVPVPEERGELGILAEALDYLRIEVRSRLAEIESERGDLRSVLNGLGDAVFLVEGRVVRLANAAANSLFGAPPTAWRGATLEESPLPASLAAELDERLEGQDGAAWEWGPDPLKRYLRVITVPLAPSGDTSRRLIVIADVTERRRLDSVRRDFVSNASHELKTPAASIQLLAESAATAAGDGDTEQALAFVEQIEGEARRLRQLVGELLDLSRLETVPPADAIADIRHIVELCITGHGSAAAARGVELRTDYSEIEGEDVFVQADPTDVTVALDNILDNAVSYTERGEIVVSLRAVLDEIEIVVTDTGIGIPEVDQDRVFERFYRVDPARTRHTGGTGLGLSLVRHAVQRSGGHVALDSVPGRGTTVTVKFVRAS